MWVDSVKLEYHGKIVIQEKPEFFLNIQSFAVCWMKLSIRYNFWIDLDDTNTKLSFDYSLNICFSCRFPFTDGQWFSQYKPLQNVYF